MIGNGTDMSTPVTRGELREELGELESRIERKFDDKLGQLERKLDGKIEQLDGKIEQLDGKIEQLDRKVEQLNGKVEQLDRKFDDKIEQLDRKFDNNLGIWGEWLKAEIEKSEKRTASTLKAEIAASEERTGARLEKHMSTEIARHIQAGFEAMADQNSVIDEKYKDLPARVTQLEVDVRARKRR